MKKIYAFFERIENAKAAAGRIKKEGWNRSDVVVIFPGETSESNGDKFEFGDEHFLDSPMVRKISPWPVLQDQELEGVGKVKMAASFKPDAPDPTVATTEINKELVAAGLQKNKVVAIIEADDEIIPRIETILESEGGEITFFTEKREEM